MERADILNQIKDAELATIKKKEDCQSECQKILSDAEDEAKAILQDAEDKRRTYRNTALENFKKEIEKKKYAILEQGDKDAKALVERTSKKLDSVINDIVSEFEHTFNV
ncbi:MAG: V-type ATPase subunit subunit G family protein [Planctomycetota bacterium]|jgi:vacuolar-type H+-ATPase subunit H